MLVHFAVQQSAIVLSATSSMCQFVAQDVFENENRYFKMLGTRFSLMAKTRCSAIAKKPRFRVRYSFGQNWKTGTGRQYFTDIIGLSSTTVI